MYTAQQSINKKVNQYLANEILNARPEQLIMKVYDFAILHCQKNDLVKTNEALQILINALNFNNPEAAKISAGLLSLYQYCQEQMRKKNSSVVFKILTELRETWSQALAQR